MRSLNLDQLRTLTEVVTCGSFSAAARRFNQLNLLSAYRFASSRPVSASAWWSDLTNTPMRRARLAWDALTPTRESAPEPGRKLVQAAHCPLEDCNVIEQETRHYRQGWLG